MIQARDWIPFLKAGISLDELPIPPEHVEYCKQWLRENRDVDNIHNEIQFLLQGYPPCVYARKDIHKDLYSCESWRKVKPIFAIPYEPQKL